MKKYIVYIATFLLLLPMCANAQNTDALAKAVNDLSREESLKHATLAVSVYKIDSQKELFSFNSQRAVIPASVTKLFTTAAGFDQLGSNFRFKTTLAYSGTIDANGNLNGDLYILGGGDPLLGSYRYKQTVPDTVFASWYRAVSRAGIRAVLGRVYYDATIFDRHPLHDSWEWGDVGNYYAGGVTGLNFHENMFFIYFNPGNRVGHPASIARVAPKGLMVQTLNEVMTGPAKSGDNVVVYGDPMSPFRTCTGTIPLDAKNFSIRASLPQPGQACADLFTAYLREHKIKVSGAGAEAMMRPDKLKTLVDITSPTYYVIAQYTNMTSNNTYAEAIYKYMGFKAHGMGSFANGGRVVSDFLKRHNVDASGIRLEDGSGLSRYNRVTTDFVCRFLLAMSQAKFFKDFQSSLALAGENGTVKNLLKDLPAGYKVRMKTGSINSVRAFAGYVTTPKGSQYCFAVICNDFDCSGAQMRSKLEKIILKIATLE